MEEFWPWKDDKFGSGRNALFSKLMVEKVMFSTLQMGGVGTNITRKHF